MTRKFFLAALALGLFSTVAWATISGGSSGGGATITGTPGDVPNFSGSGALQDSGSALGSAAFQSSTAFDASGAAAAAQTASDPSGSAATVKSYFTNLSGYLNCNGSGTCTAATTIPLASGGTGATSAGSQQTVIANNTSILLPHWRAAVARVMAGTGNAVIADVGNSTSVGINDNGTPDQMQTSPMAQLTNMLNRNGVNANFQNRIGVTGGTDVRLVTTGWSQGGAHIGGNNSTYANSANTQSFTAAQPFDTVVLYWYSSGTTATFSYDIDGGTATNVVTGTTTGNYTTSFTVPYGTHRIDINWVSAYPGFIGYNTYTSTKNRVDVFALGASGVTSAYFNGLTGYCQLSQDLTIIHTMDINDYSHGVSLGQHIINVQAAITQYKACRGGDVLLVTDIPTVVGQNGGAPSNAVQQTYIAADNQLAITNNLPIVDTATKWQSYVVSSAFYKRDSQIRFW